MRTKYLLRASCAPIVLALLANPAGAMAQQLAKAQAPAEPTDANLPDAAKDSVVKAVKDADAEAQQPSTIVEERLIVVTGSKFQKLLDAPVPVTVITAEDRNLAGVVSTRQLLNTQPGFNFTEDFGIAVRGVGRQTAQTLLGQENSVIQYVDGFINLVPFNIAESTLFGGNVQFIRGPAGTTYGRNAIAGAINIQSRAPTPTFVGQAQVGLAQGGGWNVGANIAGPITENLGFRLGAQKYVQPSLSTNLAPGSLNVADAGFAVDNLYVEAQLEWRVGGFHIRNRTTTFRYSNQPSYPSVSRYNLTPVFGGLSPNPQYNYHAVAPSQPRQINVDTIGYDNLRNNFQTIFNADLDVGFATVYYVGGYQTYRATGQADRDLTSRASYTAAPTDPFFPGTVVPTQYTTNYDNDNHFWSQEFRLESKPGSPVAWIAGFYHYDQHFNEHYWEAIPGAGAVLATGGGGGTIPGGNPLKAEFEQRNIYDITSTAVFGNASYNFSDTLTLEGGLRYTWDQKTATTNFRYIFYYPPFFAGDVSPAIHSANPKRNDSAPTGRLSLAWRPEANEQLYISYSRGYQSSAFTLGQGRPPTNVSEPEYLDVYEIGGFYSAGKLRFDGSVFYQNFHQMQIPIQSANILPPVPPQTQPSLGPLYTTFTNADLAKIYGVEGQLTWRPNKNSNIVASYTYLHAAFQNFCPAVTGSTRCGVVDITQPPLIGGVINPLYFRDLSGNDVPRVPMHTASIYGYYGIELGGLGFLYPGGSLTYQSSYYTDAFNRNQVGGRTIVGITTTYRTHNERFEITGAISNLFNIDYSDTSTLASTTGNVQRLNTYAQGRFWSLTGRVRF